MLGGVTGHCEISLLCYRIRRSVSPLCGTSLVQVGQDTRWGLPLNFSQGHQLQTRAKSLWVSKELTKVTISLGAARCESGAQL